MLRLLLILVMTCLLTGCPAAAFVAGGAAGGAVAGDSRNLGTIKDDHQIIYDANKKISADPAFGVRSHIVVVSYNYVVLLVGQAPNENVKAKAEQIVKALPGVRRVYNKITIGEPTTAMTQSNDGILTTNIRARMLATTNLDSNRFKVVTEDGVVYLMGLSTPEQADIAAQVASHSTGVRKVVKLVETAG